jgi:hypothetical protein
MGNKKGGKLTGGEGFEPFAQVLRSLGVWGVLSGVDRAFE